MGDVQVLVSQSEEYTLVLRLNQPEGRKLLYPPIQNYLFKCHPQKDQSIPQVAELPGRTSLSPLR